MKRRTLFAGIILIIGAFSVWLWQSPATIWDFMPRSVAVVFGPKPVHGFSLINHNGQPTTHADYSKNHLLVFFGYTYCPDVCPTALSDIADVLDELGDKAKNVIPLFISVDPKRDNPEHLKSYVENFHPRTMGLTGSAEQIAEAAKTFKVRYLKLDDKDGDPETYLMGHSSTIFFIGPKSQLLTSFNHTTKPEDMQRQIAEHLSRDG